MVHRVLFPFFLFFFLNTVVFISFYEHIGRVALTMLHFLNTSVTFRAEQLYTANSTEHIGRVLNVTTFEHLTRVQKFKKVYLDHLKDISGFEYVHRVQSSKIEF